MAKNKLQSIKGEDESICHVRLVVIDQKLGQWTPKVSWNRFVQTYWFASIDITKNHTLVAQTREASCSHNSGRYCLSHVPQEGTQEMSAPSFSQFPMVFCPFFVFTGDYWHLCVLSLCSNLSLLYRDISHIGSGFLFSRVVLS